MSIIQQIAALEKNGESFVLCTIVSAKGSTPRHEGSKMIVFQDGKITGSVGGGIIESKVICEAIESFSSKHNKLVKYDLDNPEGAVSTSSMNCVEVFIEPILQKNTIIVVGAGHIGKQVVHLAKWMEYHVILSDERAELCNHDSISDADDYLICKMSEIPNYVEIDSHTYFILLTRNSDVDIEGLPAIILKEPGYIGVLGSKRRWESTKTGLLKSGISGENIDKIHAPIGIDINAETPQEIALCIMSQIVMLSNNKLKK